MQQTWNKQAFILLPNDHLFSRLLATYVHKEIGHLGNEATVAATRRKYWIIGIHKVVKEIRSKCVPCKKKFKVLAGQIMADLPVERLKHSPPFHTTGLDYFGPFIIKGEVQKRIRGKSDIHLLRISDRLCGHISKLSNRCISHDFTAFCNHPWLASKDSQ